MSSILLLLAFLVSLFLLQGLTLWGLAKIFQAPRAGFWRCVGIMLLQAFFNVFIFILASRFAENPTHPAWLWEAATGLTVLVFWLIVYRLVVTRLVAATVVTVLVACLTAGLAVGVMFLLPHVGVGMYTITSNNMTPTLRGLHYEGKHPETAETLLVPRLDMDFERPQSYAISPATRAVILLKDWNKTPKNGDRIMVNHLLMPRRFDLAVYRPPPHPDPRFPPRNPNTKFVGRLIGLPGEEVEIRGGDIWIDGAKLDLPTEMSGHRVFDGDGFDDPAPFEAPPRKLAETEYFILGDFSVYSSDSRAFGPVSTENLLGCVTAIYWPPSRWQLMR